MSRMINDWPEKPLEPAWITIGNFDGVHLGHQALIAELITHARQDKVLAVALTFWPHPRVYFTQEVEGFYLNDRTEKNELLAKTGLDVILCLPFNQQLADLDTQQFLRKLNSLVPLKGLLVGENFALGKGRQGTGNVLQSVCSAMGVPCLDIPPVMLDGQVISSQRIRQTLDSGEVEQTARLLGRPYVLTGYVAPGKHRGAKLGFPTANLYFDIQRKLPRFGVYATFVEVDGLIYQGVTSVGIRPTFDDGRFPSVETLLLDFDADIYGKLIQVKFVKFLRDEIKYDQIEDLIDQIEQDKIDARRILDHGV
ncbi:MAG: bifunctional riboflavin kinase/FAD synthetase [Chloroflexi bacterium]|nr:bifunctional riboflavin kinase/FAD synthetase [Chloroflexota bacterium]